MHPPGQFRLLTLHYGMYQLAIGMGVGFAGAYLLQLGFSIPQALACFAALFATRFLLRFLSLGLVRRLGFRHAVIAGALMGALQFLPLYFASEPAGLFAWLLLIAMGEACYWTVYHAAVAVTGVDGSRGRELGIRSAVGGLVGIAAPFIGGLLMHHAGPAINFALGASVMALSVLPLLFMRDFPGGPVPPAGDVLRGLDRRAVLAFAADGWMASGLQFAWPMVLFTVLGASFENLGFANALAGLAGAAGGLICGRAIDRGSRDKYLALVCLALAIGFGLRAMAGWSALAALIANASAAAVMGVYVPVLMSHIYDRAKESGAAYQFHFTTEAGWDVGAVCGCLVAAMLVILTDIPSLAVVPGAFGILVLFAFVRRQPARAAAPAKEYIDA